MPQDRTEREKAAYDEGQFRSARRQFVGVFSYIYRSPNSLRVKAAWQDLVRESVTGKKILEIGCGEGWDCRKYLAWGAGEVHGIDLSPAMLALAREHEGPFLKFFEHDLHQPWPHRYDLIVGRSVLHHLDYRAILPSLYERNLEPGGRMVFVEPLGEGLLMRLYWKFGRRFHTPDERPFRRQDIEWLRSRFSSFRLLPMNYTSLPAAGLSWLLRISPDNPLTRASDRLDVFLAERVRFLELHFRSAVFLIEKEGSLC